jgi:hypothetical protein
LTLIVPNPELVELLQDKIKVGYAEADIDRTRVTAVREQVGSDVTKMVDSKPAMGPLGRHAHEPDR